MSASPAVHHRRSIRLKGYDYAQAGAYFITICTHGRVPFFCKIDKGEMKLTEFGQIAHDQWQQIPNRFENVELAPFVVMPNHIHGIIVTPAPFMGAPAADDETPNIGGWVGASPTHTQPQGLPLRVTVGDIVGAYKSLVANECLKIYKTKNELMGKLWQRNYYEHIIRDEKSYIEIAQYIIDNPAKWALDSLSPRGTP